MTPACNQAEGCESTHLLNQRLERCESDIALLRQEDEKLHNRITAILTGGLKNNWQVIAIMSGILAQILVAWLKR